MNTRMTPKEEQRIRSRVGEVLEEEADAFEMARWTCQEYFQEIVDEKNLNDGTRTRRAPIGFRLILPPLFEDDMIRYVAAIRPGMARSYGAIYLVPERLEIDVIHDKWQQISNDQMAHNIGPAVKLRIADDEIKHAGYRFSTVLPALGRLADTLREWVDDPSSMLVGSSDRCLFCCKTLTDDVSRTRGIGPECQKRYQLLDVISTRRPKESESMLIRAA